MSFAFKKKIPSVASVASLFQSNSDDAKMAYCVNKVKFLNESIFADSLS